MGSYMFSPESNDEISNMEPQISQNPTMNSFCCLCLLKIKQLAQRAEVENEPIKYFCFQFWLMPPKALRTAKVQVSAS